MSFLFTNKPPQHWNDLCVQHGDLFNTSEWHRVLSDGFGSKTIYGWDEATSTGLSITVFKAGPFRIGYLGFPVGGTMGGGTISPEMVEALKKADFSDRIHCLRIPVSAFVSNIDLPIPSQITPETTIENLQEWRPETNYKLYRDIKKARHSLLRVSDATDPLQGDTIFGLYRDTISRRHGNIRYTLNYFNELINLAKRHFQLRCLLAIKDGTVAGFLIVACHHKTTYYLHGAMDPEFKRYTPSDLLLYEAINWAKRMGMDYFNMMASPLNQLSLVRYKEKWGGVTRQQRTYDLALRPFHTMAFKAAATLYQRAPKFPREMA